MSGLRRALAAAALAIAAAVGGLEIYTRTSARVTLPELALPGDLRHLVLLIHGSADADDPLLGAILARLEGHAPPGTAVRLLNWQPWSDDRLRAAANARRLGTALGRSLAAIPTLAQLTLVAHSAGAYVPDALCEAFRPAAGRPVRVDMDFLDPFQIRGFVDWRHGAREHGRCADFALAVINTDDPAPATSRPLARAHNIDVTDHPGRVGFPRNGHYWPLAWYAEDWLPGPAASAPRSHEVWPRGALRSPPDLAAGAKQSRSSAKLTGPP